MRFSALIFLLVATVASTVTAAPLPAPVPSYEKPSVWQRLDNALAKKLGLKYLVIPPYGSPLMRINEKGERECKSLRGDKYVPVPCPT
ncbi:hypothetical protein FS842_007837 [Serendipita sp. 407]|nr:hypothetical protein FRC18_008833 [Serendipita sp. 400]KAG9019497.1 hypothetical protein FS842_007837 [Serendipita sp. 407]